MSHKIEPSGRTRIVRVPINQLTVTDDCGDLVSVRPYGNGGSALLLRARTAVGHAGEVVVELNPADAAALGEYLLAWVKGEDQ